MYRRRIRTNNSDYISTLCPQGCLYTWGINNHAQLGIIETNFDNSRNYKQSKNKLFVNYDIISQTSFSDRNKILNQFSQHNGPFHQTPVLINTV